MTPEQQRERAKAAWFSLGEHVSSHRVEEALAAADEAVPVITAQEAVDWLWAQRENVYVGPDETKKKDAVAANVMANVISHFTWVFLGFDENSSVGKSKGDPEREINEVRKMFAAELDKARAEIGQLRETVATLREEGVG